MKTISIQWSTDDVVMTAEKMGFYLTDNEADKILDELLENHDPQLGINWDVIENYIQKYIDEKQN